MRSPHCTAVVCGTPTFAKCGTLGNQNKNNLDLPNLPKTRPAPSSCWRLQLIAYDEERMSNPISLELDTLLTREQAAAALTEAGFPIKAKTLASRRRPGRWTAVPALRLASTLSLGRRHAMGASSVKQAGRKTPANLTPCEPWPLHTARASQHRRRPIARPGITRSALASDLLPS